MAIEKSPTALRTIGEVAEELDIATHVLRFWESKFHQIKPQKRRGRRYYRPEDINTLSQIKILLYGEGYTIRGVQKFLAGGGKKKAESNNNLPQATSQNITPEQARPAAKQISKPKSNVESDWFSRDLFGNVVAEETEAESVTIEEIVSDSPINSNVQPVKVEPVIINKMSEADLSQIKQAHEGLLKIQESLFDLL